MSRVAPISDKSDVRATLHAPTAGRRHHAWVLVPCLLALFVASASAQDKSPKAAPPPTSTPTSESDSFVYVAPSFIKELDSKYPAQPPVPPSPPRYGGVLHFPAVVRAFDPTVGYRPELALVWDTLTEWESTWYFPEVQRTPVIRKTLATSWEMKNPSTWIFNLRQRREVSQPASRQRPRDDGRGREVLLRSPEGQGPVRQPRGHGQEHPGDRQVHPAVRAQGAGSQVLPERGRFALSRDRAS